MTDQDKSKKICKLLTEKKEHFGGNEPTSKEFQMKQALIDFVSPFAIGDGRTQFALVATAIDSELYGTNFHSGQDR